jgi:hypothetical protein
LDTAVEPKLAGFKRACQTANLLTGMAFCETLISKRSIPSYYGNGPGNLIHTASIRILLEGVIIDAERSERVTLPIIWVLVRFW